MGTGNSVGWPVTNQRRRPRHWYVVVDAEDIGGVRFEMSEMEGRKNGKTKWTREPQKPPRFQMDQENIRVPV